MASRNFNECSKNGGRVKTKTLKNGKVIKICYDDTGKSHTKVIKKREDRMPKKNQAKATVSDIEKLKAYFDKQKTR